MNDDTGAVKDIQWNHDSTQLLTASFDKFIKLVDIETTKVIQVTFDSFSLSISYSFFCLLSALYDALFSSLFLSLQMI
jgi:WD40 repeat protein